MTSTTTSSGSSASPASAADAGAVADHELGSLLGFDRLRSARDVTTTMRRGHRRAGRFAVVHVRMNDLDVTRLTFVASRKVGTAVRRNRSKRLLREAARCIPWRAGLDIVLVARADTATAGLAEVIAEVQALADHLDLVATP